MAPTWAGPGLLKLFNSKPSTFYLLFFAQIPILSDLIMRAETQSYLISIQYLAFYIYFYLIEAFVVKPCIIGIKILFLLSALF